MQVKFSNKGTTLIVNIIGELDHHTAEYIRQKIDGEIIRSRTKNVVFDFSKVSFMDSSGIGIIMGRYKNIQILKGKMAIANVSAQVKRIFEMHGLLKIIPVYEGLENAINKMM